MNHKSTLTVGQNVGRLRESRVITGGHTFVYEGRALRFMLLRVESLDMLEGVLTDEHENIVHVFEMAVPAPTYGLEKTAARVPISKVDSRYIYQNMFSDEIGRVFFRKHSTNLEMLKAIFNNDVAKVGEIDQVFLGILTHGRILRNEFSENQYSTGRNKLYPTTLISSREIDVRVNINGENTFCKRTLSIYFHNLNDTDKIPPILAEYEFHSRARGIGKTGIPMTLSLKRRYRDGKWPNAKAFVEHPRNKPYLDLFFGENPNEWDD